MGWEGSFRKPPDYVRARVNLLFGGGQNVWPSIESRWAVAQEAARVATVPISSWWRDPRLNRSVGGARYSQHQLGLAWDIPNSQLSGVDRARLAAALRAQGFHAVQESDHLHVQTLTPSEFAGSGARAVIDALRAGAAR